MPAMPSRPSVAVRKRLPDDEASGVDTRDERSLSFAPPDRPVGQGQLAEPSAGPPARGRAPEARSRRRRPRLIVEGARAAAVAASRASTGGPLGSMPEFPVQISKVQAPPLRDETLARDRLLDWLSVKIHRRAVLLTAEAGYGKTTLLADFTRRTRLRVLWFRLDRGDRDWTGFIAHLVAAIRIHLPEFGPVTRSLLAETATTAPSLETVLETFLRELVSLPAEPSALVLDDFHLVDDSPDIRLIVRELLTRGPERLTFVFASRREPPIRLARLRALGEVAELGTDDLRFDATETERLFRDTYEMRLEPSVLAELSRRTEGWAASLQLVRAALNDRDPGQVRSFISSLSGAEGHLYEYLAEEVIGELPGDLQEFLMRTSVLETVDLTLGPVAAGVTVEEAKRLIEEGERHGLFGKGGRARHIVRAHPLVRDFLQSRMVNIAGVLALRAVNLRVARAAAPSNWKIAAQQYLAAEHHEDASAVLAGSIEQIVGSGALSFADELSSAIPGGLGGSAGLVLRSRIARQQASAEEGLRLAEEALEVDPDSSIGLLNLVAARSFAGDIRGAVDAGRALEGSDRIQIAEMGKAFRKILETSVVGSVRYALRDLERVIESLRSSGETHFLGVGLLNRAYLSVALAEPTVALESADEAIALLTPTSSGVDLISARMARASALAFLGRLEEARAEIRIAAASAESGQRVEFALEVGQIEGHLGESGPAWPFLERVVDEISSATDDGEQALLARILLLIRDGRMDAAKADAGLLVPGRLSTAIAMDSQRHLVAGLTLALCAESSALERIRRGLTLARAQGASLWVEYGQLLEQVANNEVDPSAAVVRAEENFSAVLSMLAEVTLRRAGELSAQASSALVREAQRRPWRWRLPARRLVQTGPRSGRAFGAQILELVGEEEDVLVLRLASRSKQSGVTARHAIALARRLADKVFVEDLGRVRISVGNRSLDGSEVRRKVLALLCLLLSRPRFASTRDEVIDSLWPDHDPESALNSLNQTVYFLRRVFEPLYREESSPGYLGQDAETIWLDPDLVECRSRRCLELTQAMPGEPTPEHSVALASEYRGKYALDFAYEDWATPYRDYLHASYLRVMERAIQMDLSTGQVTRGTFLAERAAEVDPDADEIQVALVRLYRMAGAHAAAAERYAHYERGMRDLGLEPVPLADM
jgi:DNA-binding SARP family transcriptional activator